MGRSCGRGTGKEEFTMSGTGWCPGLDYEGNPEGCFIGFPEGWMLLPTSNPDLEANPEKEPCKQKSFREMNNGMHGKRQNLHCEQQCSEQGEACGLPKEKGDLCLQVHVALGLLNGWGPRPNWPEMLRSRKDPPLPHLFLELGMLSSGLHQSNTSTESRMHFQEPRARFQSRDSQPKPSKNSASPFNLPMQQRVK